MLASWPHSIIHVKEMCILHEDAVYAASEFVHFVAITCTKQFLPELCH